jgi:hypothetical protein
MNLFKLLLVFICILFLTPTLAADFPIMDPDNIISTYGTPDKIDSTAYDKPRPLFVTKWLIYKKAKLKFIFIADAPMGSPPPYKT